MMVRISMKAAISLDLAGLSIEYRVPHGANFDGIICMTAKRAFAN